IPTAKAHLEQAAADIPLTRSARDILERAANTAKARGANASPTDVLQATLSSRGTPAYEAIKALGIDPSSIASQLRAAETTNAPTIPLRQLLVNANREAQVLGHYQVDSIHLLLALLYSDSPSTSQVLQKAGLTLYDVRQHLQTGARPDVQVTPGVRTTQDRKLRHKPLTSLKGALGISPIFGGIVAVAAISGAGLWFDVLPAAPWVLTIIFVTSGWITSLCIHEFGHAFVAYLGGDPPVQAW